MGIYYAIRSLGSLIEEVRQTIYAMAVTTRSVFIIGANLYQWFASISSYMILVVSAVYALADEYRDFYDQIQSSLNVNVNIGQLLYYAEDIISIIRDPGYFVRNTIISYFPGILQIISDPVSFVISTIVQRTSLDTGILFDVRGFVQGLIDAALGNIKYLIADPSTWIRKEIELLSPVLMEIITDGRGWLRSEFKMLAPGLDVFLNDPETFILDKVVTGLEKFIAKYQTRLIKLAERVINAIF